MHIFLSKGSFVTHSPAHQVPFFRWAPDLSRQMEKRSLYDHLRPICIPGPAQDLVPHDDDPFFSLPATVDTSWAGWAHPRRERTPCPLNNRIQNRGHSRHSAPRPLALVSTRDPSPSYPDDTWVHRPQAPATSSCVTKFEVRLATCPFPNLSLTSRRNVPYLTNRLD